MHDSLRVVGVALEDGKVVRERSPRDRAVTQARFLRLHRRRQGAAGHRGLRQRHGVIPWALAENGGLDAIDVVIQLKSAHEKKNGKNMGINLDTGKPDDMLKLNVIEPLRVKTQAVKSAAEVANMILRIDDVIASRKAPPMPPGAQGGMPPGMGGMPGM